MLDYTRVQEDMDVYDARREKLGSIGEVRTPSGATGTTGTGTASTEESAFKVDTGLLGLGKHLYIPFSAISDIRGDAVQLNVDRDDLERLGWDHKPIWWG